MNGRLPGQGGADSSLSLFFFLLRAAPRLASEEFMAPMRPDGVAKKSYTAFFRELERRFRGNRLPANL